MRLTKDEIEYLLSVLKKIIATKEEYFTMPLKGESKKINLVSDENSNDTFIVDINRSNNKRIQELKITFNERYRKDTVLLRLDLNSPPHRNPDGHLLSGNHLHIAREGYDDRFAIEVPECFVDLSSPAQTLIDFLTYCKVKDAEKIEVLEGL